MTTASLKVTPELILLQRFYQEMGDRILNVGRGHILSDLACHELNSLDFIL